MCRREKQQVQKQEKCGNFVIRTEDFSNLAILSFVQVGLESLEGLPNLPMLSCLNLSDNKLTGGLEVLADKCPDLAYIILSGNSLKDIDVLKPLARWINCWTWSCATLAWMTCLTIA
uniref:Uncharacterized protein n=1 Tax=Ditylenchus dipsaci TaxID=166011 RepID=A0A915DB91_9BILA